MEQRKSDINNGDDNVINASSNGLNYSFDFSSQVNPAGGQATPMAGPQPVNQGVPPTPQPSVVQSNSVAPMEMNNGFTNQVQPEPVQAIEPTNQAQSEPVQAIEPTNQVQPEPVSDPMVQIQPETAQATEPINQVQPESVQATGSNVVQTGEQVSQAQSNGPIIKDKKATKTFLFIIVGLIIIFIIALPFIFNVIG